MAPVRTRGWRRWREKEAKMGSQIVTVFLIKLFATRKEGANHVNRN
jgi:hypothetical protein